MRQAESVVPRPLTRFIIHHILRLPAADRSPDGYPCVACDAVRASPHPTDQRHALINVGCGEE